MASSTSVSSILGLDLNYLFLGVATTKDVQFWKAFHILQNSWRSSAIQVNLLPVYAITTLWKTIHFAEDT